MITKEDFEKSDDYSDMVFIGQRTQSRYDFTSDNKHINFTVCRNDEVKVFDLYRFFKLVFSYCAFTATNQKDDLEAIKVLCRGKSDAIIESEEIKRILAHHDTCLQYKFSGFIKQYDAMIEMAQAELQTKILDSQINTNASTITTNNNIITTNNNIRNSNEALKSIFTKTLIAAVAGLVLSASNIVETIRKDISDTSLKEVQAKLKAADSENVHLKKVLDSVFHKP